MKIKRVRSVSQRFCNDVAGDARCLCGITSTVVFGVVVVAAVTVAVVVIVVVVIAAVAAGRCRLASRGKARHKALETKGHSHLLVCANK